MSCSRKHKDQLRNSYYIRVYPPQLILTVIKLIVIMYFHFQADSFIVSQSFCNLWFTPVSVVSNPQCLWYTETYLCQYIPSKDSLTCKLIADVLCRFLLDTNNTVGLIINFN